MAKEHEIREKRGSLSDKVKPIFSDYASAVDRLSDESGRDTLLRNIKHQVKTLEYDSGVLSNIDFSSTGGNADLKRLIESLGSDE